ncbi:MAG TPA: DUF1236 domain-containing protein [Xanthobacteraceae bacterium]|nr:DUF1236 domain-containing protein [Xanthobacteraceae bacterium]
MLRLAMIALMLIGTCAMAAAQGEIGPGSGSGALPSTTPSPSLAPDANVPSGSTVVEEPLALDPAQKQAILRGVRQEKGRVRQPAEFKAAVGAPVPPSIELYALPDGVLTEVPETKLYRYTVVGDEVVLVDPVRMRVVDVLH